MGTGQWGLEGSTIVVRFTMTRQDAVDIQADIDDAIVAERKPTKRQRFGELAIGAASAFVGAGVIYWLTISRERNGDRALVFTLLVIGTVVVMALLFWAIHRDTRKRLALEFAKRPLTVGELETLGTSEWRFARRSRVREWGHRRPGCIMPLRHDRGAQPRRLCEAPAESALLASAIGVRIR
ncbi:MAG: hypothetical protein QM783_20255 [Phycisphaerales bacterium]